MSEYGSIEAELEQILAEATRASQRRARLYFPTPEGPRHIEVAQPREEYL